MVFWRVFKKGIGTISTLGGEDQRCILSAFSACVVPEFILHAGHF